MEGRDSQVRSPWYPLLEMTESCSAFVLHHYRRSQWIDGEHALSCFGSLKDWRRGQVEDLWLANCLLIEVHGPDQRSRSARYLSFDGRHQ